jgi:hypothetical protein
MTNNIIDPTDEPIPTAPYIVTINQPYASGYQVGPNQVFCFPFLVGQNQRIMYNALHTSYNVQDYTLAAWFSTAPYNPVLFYSNRTYIVHLLKRKASQFALQDINYVGPQQYPPPSVRTIDVEPGMYYFNIENLTGHINKFEFQFTITDLQP